MPWRKTKSETPTDCCSTHPDFGSNPPSLRGYRFYTNFYCHPDKNEPVLAGTERDASVVSGSFSLKPTQVERFLSAACLLLWACQPYDVLWAHPDECLIMNMNKTTKTKKATNGTVNTNNSTTTPASAPKPVALATPAKPAPAASAAPLKPVAPARAATPSLSATTISASTASTVQAGVVQSPAKPAPTRELNPAPKAKVALELVNPTAKSVAVAGSFNGWNPARTPLKPAGAGKWVGELTGISGRHEYLFVVDGQWLPDPKAKESVQNPFGGRNSVLVVPSN